MVADYTAQGDSFIIVANTEVIHSAFVGFYTHEPSDALGECDIGATVTPRMATDNVT